MRVGVFSGLQAKSADKRSCGSAFFLGIINGRAFVCSNAHVWGSVIGARAFVVGVRDDGSVIEVSGSVRFAAYRQGTSIDWAIAELSVSDYMSLPGADASKRLVDFDPSKSIGYVGGPRCELPSFRRVKYVRLAGGVVYGTPAAIGGMSGGAWQHDGSPCAITTWTDGTHNMAQPGQALRATMNPDFFNAIDSDPGVEPECPCEKQARVAALDGYTREDFTLPPNAVPACEFPQACADGFFAAVDDLTPLEIVDHAMHPLEVRDCVAAGEFDWLELLRVLLPLLLEWLKNRPR